LHVAEVAFGAPGLPSVFGDVEDHGGVGAVVGACILTAVAVVEDVDERRVGVGGDGRLPVVAGPVHDPLAGPPGRRGSPNGFHDPDRPRRGRGLERVEALIRQLLLLLELLGQALLARFLGTRSLGRRRVGRRARGHDQPGG